MSYSVGDPGHCHEVTFPATWHQPAELCERDTHALAFYCDVHGGPAADDPDVTPDPRITRP